jgi:hypothetical protein
MNCIKALHQDIVPTFLKAGAWKIRILAVRKSRKAKKEDSPVTANRKAAWLDMLILNQQSSRSQQHSNNFRWDRRRK